MKTTVEISDALLAAARRVMRREGVTLRVLIEEGLRQRLEGDRASEFRLRPASFGGNGLRPDLDEGSWETIRRRAYEGRGG